MVTLVNPISKQNIVDRFAEYVRDTSNAGIVWGSNALPFSGFTPTNVFGGTTSGKNLDITGSSITGDTVNAQTIFDVLVGETRNYSKIRKMRAILFVTGGGGNTGSRSTPGIIFDSTQVAHMSDGYLQTITANKEDVLVNNSVTSAGLERFYTNLRTAYNTARNTSAGTFQTNVCHSSCHSSCHNSRSRR